MVGITDPRQAKAALTRAANEFLTELAGFAEKMSDSGWFQTLEGDGEPQSTEARTYQER